MEKDADIQYRKRRNALRKVKKQAADVLYLLPAILKNAGKERGSVWIIDVFKRLHQRIINMQDDGVAQFAFVLADESVYDGGMLL